MGEIKIRIIAEIAQPWGHVTVDLRQLHRVAGRSLRGDVDLALQRGVDQVRDMYRTSGRAVRDGS